MKVVILAGGYGTRISEETHAIPKPMVEIGGKPILWHVMKTYASYGFNEFVILLGYKGNVIRNYFLNYHYSDSSFEVDLKTNTTTNLFNGVEPWKVTLLETGLNTMTGGRIKRAQEIIGKEPFLLTYGDGVANINISDLVSHHESSKKLLTMSVIQPMGRFGAIEFNEKNELVNFVEKAKGDLGWINGGYFVCEPSVFDYIKDGDTTIFEKTPLETLTEERHINCYKHDGFWKCMDSLADKNTLNDLWDTERALWKIW